MLTEPHAHARRRELLLVAPLLSVGAAAGAFLAGASSAGALVVGGLVAAAGSAYGFRLAKTERKAAATGPPPALVVAFWVWTVALVTYRLVRGAPVVDVTLVLAVAGAVTLTFGTVVTRRSDEERT